MKIKAKKTDTNFDMGIVDRFSWHKNSGDFAEGYFLREYFKGLGLSFRKIRKDKKGRKPDGYILDSNKNKIAVAEIKLIKRQSQRGNGFSRIRMDETIQNQIRKAKKQLKSVDEELPKIVYLILDDTFAKFKNVMIAVFGKWITIDRGGKIIYNGYSGLCSKYREDNRLRDNLLSAVVCYKKTLSSYKIYLIQNTDSVALPKILLDKNHLEELWDYNSKGLRRIYASVI